MGVTDTATGVNTLERINEPIKERMLLWFKFEHLPPHLREVARRFWILAFELCGTIPRGPERTVMLRKLLESKDAAVRACMEGIPE